MVNYRRKLTFSLENGFVCYGEPPIRIPAANVRIDTASRPCPKSGMSGSQGLRSVRSW